MIMTLKEKLTLALIRLTAWEDKFITAKQEETEMYRAWKGYDFRVLDSLTKEGFTFNNRPGFKSFYLTDEGVQQGDDLLKKLEGLL